MLLPLKVRRWSRRFTGTCLLIALLALVGWQFDIGILKRPMPGLVALNPTTAFCVFLLATSLLTIDTEKKSLRFLGIFFSILCLVIGSVRLAESFFLFSFQVDQLIYSSKLHAEEFNGHPNRMAQDGAINFILASGAILMLYRRSYITVVQWIALIIGLVAWFSMMGYMYQVPEFYGLLPYLPMSLYTVICFILLSMALLTFLPERGFAKEIFSSHEGGKVSRAILPIILIVPLLLGYIRLLAHWKHMISTEFGVAMLVVCITAVVTTTVFVSLKLLNKRDAEQKNFQKDLVDLNRELYQKNDEINALIEEMAATNEELTASNEELTAMNEQLQAASEKIQQQAEIIVKQKDEQLNRVLDSSLDVIWSIDLSENGENYLSRSAEKLFGNDIDHALITEAFWTERTHENDREICQQAFRQLQETGNSESTYRVRLMDGAYRWFNFRSKLINNDLGKPIRFEGIAVDVTEYKKQEKKLNQYRENLDVIFSNTVEEILLLDIEGRVVLFNKALENFLTFATGLKPETGKYVWEITSPERSENARELFERASRGESITIDAAIHTPKGPVVHELRYEPVFIDHKVKYVTVISVDVTEKKNRQNLLRQSEANLRSIFENTEDAFTLLDKDYHIVMFNTSTQNIASAGFKVGTNILDVVDASRRKIFRGYLERAEKGEPVTYDIQIGENRDAAWYHVTLSAISDHGELVGYCITTHNHTPIKRAEVILREREERFRALVENSEDIIVLIDPDRKLVYVNPGVEKITGFSIEDFLALDFNALVHPEDLRPYMQFLKEVEDHPGKLIPTSFRMRHRDGRWQWMEGTAVNLSAKESIKGTVMNFRDVTERKKYDLERSNLVGQLIEQNNDLRQFSFIVSHNLRGPVASMLGLFNLLSLEKVSADVDRLHGMMRKSVNHLDSVIKDLSVILEMRSHRLHAKEIISIRDMIQIIEVTLQSQIIEYDVMITVDDSAGSQFHTIKSYFYSILYNLVSNAIKYHAPDRTPCIEINTFATSASVGFQVKDNGIGIDLAQFGDRLFGLYQRFHLEAEGKGMGLYMVKTQVQLLNGTIEIASQPDEGATFTVSFPIHGDGN